MSNEELINTKAGISKGVLIGGISIIVTFLIGVVDGYLRPLSCNK